MNNVLYVIILLNATINVILSWRIVQVSKRHQRWFEEEMKMWDLQMTINKEMKGMTVDEITRR